MPLRDHFRSPVNDRHAWDELHGGWPMKIVETLAPTVPPGFRAAPHVYIGGAVDIDSGMIDDEYEVRIYDVDRDRRLVAAIELVSPANKDRPQTRQAFVAKCAALLQQHVSVTIVDVVTTRDFNRYAELLTFLQQSDATVADPPANTYAITCHYTLPPKGRSIFEAWHNPLAIGQPLPMLPIWLADDLVVTLDLEASYEETCRVLQIA